MTNAGYDIVKASIAKSENHSYGPSCGTTVLIFFNLVSKISDPKTL